MLRMNGAPSLEVLRAAVRRAAEVGSLRTIAEQIGISHVGVVKFLEGAPPRPSTRRKLLEWYVREGATAGEVSPEMVAAALRLLLTGLPDEARVKGSTQVAQTVQSIYREAGMRVPDWIAGLLG
jgi:hypothetical protein